jgi:hypothetical protein
MENKQNMQVIITNPYTQEVYEIQVQISDYSLNDLLDEVNSEFPIVENTGISIWDTELNIYIYCGNYPLDTYIAIPKNNIVKCN